MAGKGPRIGRTVAVAIIACAAMYGVSWLVAEYLVPVMGIPLDLPHAVGLTMGTTTLVLLVLFVVLSRQDW